MVFFVLIRLREKGVYGVVQIKMCQLCPRNAPVSLILSHFKLNNVTQVYSLQILLNGIHFNIV